MDEFKVGEVAIIIGELYRGYECTIVRSLDLIEGRCAVTGRYILDILYEIEIHGVQPLGDFQYFAPHHILKRKRPPAEKQPLGEWELCPWKPERTPCVGDEGSSSHEAKPRREPIVNGC